MNQKKSKQTSTQRLPSIYTQVLIKSEYEYKREIQRKLDQIEQDTRDAVRRRFANDHLFAHEHLTKRYKWYSTDKIYRDTCRTTWNKATMENGRTSHVFLPTIYPKNITSSMQNSLKINDDDNSTIIDEKIKTKFLYEQPVLLEIRNAPHSSQHVKNKHNLEMRKKSAQQRHANLQKNVIDDQRYWKLVYALQDS